MSKIEVVNSNRGIVGKNIISLIELTNSMSNAMIAVAGKYVPKKRYSKNKKSYWNRELKEEIKNKKRAWRIWVNAGRPKGAESEEWLNYKSCKKHFRYMLRKFENIQIVKELNEMQKDSEIDKKKF